MNSKVLCRPVHSPSANVSIVPEEKSVLAKMGHAEKYRDTVERNDHPMRFINISTQKDRKMLLRSSSCSATVSLTASSELALCRLFRSAGDWCWSGGRGFETGARAAAEDSSARTYKDLGRD